MIVTTPQGFTIKEQNEERLFKTLDDIVIYYASVLTHPFNSTLPEEPYVSVVSSIFLVLIIMPFLSVFI